MEQGVWRLSGSFGICYTEMTVNTTCQPAPHKAKLTCVGRDQADTRGAQAPQTGAPHEDQCKASNKTIKTYTYIQRKNGLPYIDWVGLDLGRPCLPLRCAGITNLGCHAWVTMDKSQVFSVRLFILTTNVQYGMCGKNFIAQCPWLSYGKQELRVCVPAQRWDTRQGNLSLE